MTKANIQEGTAAVPGARLRYRLSGAPGGLTLIFENGWGASYEMWTWVERELAPHAQLLFYNRAGVGGSELLAPQTAEGLSAQFAALPKALGLSGPIIAIGQSYGGLMCSLHAAQQRAMLESVIEIDPTPEQAHPKLDAALSKIPAVVSVIKLCARLGLPNFVFGRTVKQHLPEAEAKALLRNSLNSPSSLNNARDELDLLSDIRSAIAAGRPHDFTRLVIGAGVTSAKGGALSRALINERVAREAFECNQAQQRERARQDPGCRLMLLPYDHGGLVFSRDGAHETAAAIRDHIRTLKV